MRTKVVLNLAGFRALRTSAAAQGMVDSAAARVKAAAGSGYEVQSSPARNRAHAIVVPQTAAARVDNARNNTLLRALGARSG